MKIFAMEETRTTSFQKWRFSVECSFSTWKRFYYRSAPMTDLKAYRFRKGFISGFQQQNITLQYPSNYRMLS